jgi:CRP/FNR family transcriptional regulator/CRP/FNR family cyclic AMP-dependent transcriptional regulator
MRDHAPPSREPEHAVLFPWFPAHEVRRSERELRAESLLGHIPLFSAVPPRRLRAIADLAHRNRFAAGETVIRMGDPGSTLHIIRSGRLNVLLESQGAEPLILASLGPGEFFGELALFDQGPRSATVVATEDAETFSLGRADILEIVNRYPEVALAFLASISARLRTADNRLDNFLHPRPAKTSG